MNDRRSGRVGGSMLLLRLAVTLSLSCLFAAEAGWSMSANGDISYQGARNLERCGRLLLEGSSVDRYKAQAIEEGRVGWELERYALTAERRFLRVAGEPTVGVVDAITNTRDEERVISIAYEFWLSESIGGIDTEQQTFDLQASGLNGPISDRVLRLRGREGSSLTVLLAAPVDGLPELRSELRRSNCLYSRFQVTIPAKGTVHLALVLPDPAQDAELASLLPAWYAGVLRERLPMPDDLRGALLNFPARLPIVTQQPAGDDQDPSALAAELGVELPEGQSALVAADGSIHPCLFPPDQRLALTVAGAALDLPLARLAALRSAGKGAATVYLSDGQRWSVTLSPSCELQMQLVAGGDQPLRLADSAAGTTLLLGRRDEPTALLLARLADGQRLAVRLADGETLPGTSPWGRVSIPASSILRLEPCVEPYPYLALTMVDGSRLPLLPDAPVELRLADAEGRLPLSTVEAVERLGSDLAALEFGCDPVEVGRLLPAFSAEGGLGPVIEAFAAHLGHPCPLRQEARFLGGVPFACGLPAGSVAEQLTALRAKTGLLPRYEEDGAACAWYASAVTDRARQGGGDVLTLTLGWQLHGEATVALSSGQGGVIDGAALIELRRAEDGSLVALSADGSSRPVRCESGFIAFEGPMGRLRVPIEQCQELRFAGREEP